MKNIIKFTFSIVLLMTSIFVFDFGNDLSATSGTITIEGLTDDRSNSHNVTLYRGEMMVRKEIPYIVPAGTEVVLKQVSDLNITDLQVQVFNDDRAKEARHYLSRSGSELKFTVEYDSVIFIRRLQGNYSIDVEYSFSQVLDNVPYYEEGGDEDAFFAHWDSIDAPFAIFENEAIKFFVPKADKEYLRNLGTNTSHGNLDGLLEYYRNLMSDFDYLLGLEDNPENPAHRNNTSQFFAKANISGAGLAYYSAEETAISLPNFGSRYFKIGWIEKHEVAHGYQQNQMMNKNSNFPNSIYLSEVWNNVYAHYSRVGDMWSGDNAYSANRITGTQLQDVTRIGFDDSDLFNKLNFFIAMFDSFGYEGFRGFNREYRELANSPEGAMHNQYSNSDMMALYFSKHTGVNFVPHFEQSDIDITTGIEERAEIRDLSYAQFLNFIITDDAKRQEVATALDLQADYQMIDTSLLRDAQFSDLGLKNDVDINLNIDSLDEILYKKVILKNGTFELEQEIFSNTVSFNDVPAGVYRVLVPNSESGTYLSNSNKLLTVTETGEISFDVIYEESMNNGTIDSENTIGLRGLSNYTFASINTSADNIRINIINRAPHVYFSGREYANVKIYDNNGNLVFEKSFIGDVALPAEAIDIQIEEGYSLEITGAELGRSVGKNIYDKASAFDMNSPFVMDFKTDGTYVNDNNILPSVIDGFVDTLESDLTQFYSQDNMVYLNKMISKLSEPTRTEKLEQYKNMTQFSRPVFENVEDIYEVEIQKARSVSSLKDIISGITVSDYEDGDISANIVILDHDVDLAVAGSYVIKLRVEDSDKNANYVDIAVNVIDSSEHDDLSLPESPADTPTASPNTGIQNYAVFFILVGGCFVALKKVR